jgi:hypothetical protein
MAPYMTKKFIKAKLRVLLNLAVLALLSVELYLAIVTIAIQQ